MLPSMDTSANRQYEENDFEAGNQSAFNVVIAYEDFAAGKHAKETYDYLVNELGEDYAFNNQMWKFDVLNHPKMQEMAVKDATRADLIIISTQSSGELPPEVKSWIGEWMTKKSRAKGLAVLVNDSNRKRQKPTAVNSYLQAVAREAQMDFFAQPEEGTSSEIELALPHVPSRAGSVPTVINTPIEHQLPTVTNLALFGPRFGSSDWGINE